MNWQLSPTSGMIIHYMEFGGYTDRDHSHSDKCGGVLPAAYRVQNSHVSEIYVKRNLFSCSSETTVPLRLRSVHMNPDMTKK